MLTAIILAVLTEATPGSLDPPRICTGLSRSKSRDQWYGPRNTAGEKSMWSRCGGVSYCAALPHRHKVHPHIPSPTLCVSQLNGTPIWAAPSSASGASSGGGGKPPGKRVGTAPCIPRSKTFGPIHCWCSSVLLAISVSRRLPMAHPEKGENSSGFLRRVYAWSMCGCYTFYPGVSKCMRPEKGRRRGASDILACARSRKAPPLERAPLGGDNLPRSHKFSTYPLIMVPCLHRAWVRAPLHGRLLVLYPIPQRYVNPCRPCVSA
jgi:hypothetical protein